MAANPLTMNDQTVARRRLPNVKFRVLIVGRANAGKTSILQRVCDTTESPKTYKVTEGGRREIRLDPTSERGQHNISDELEFSNHKGYVFHDSRGLESGTADELQIIQDFVGDRSSRKSLQDRLHAIWYCIPMDGNRESLDIKPFHNICPDKNVPVIAVFTKFETFRHNTRSNMRLNGQKGNLVAECQKRFEERYLSELGVGAKFVRLEGMQKSDARCEELINTTMGTLDTATVALMLLAVQTENLGLNVQYTVSRILQKGVWQERGLDEVVKKCLAGFPILWYYDVDAAADDDFFFDSFDDDDAFDAFFDDDAFDAFFDDFFDAKRLLELLHKFAHEIAPQTTMINSRVSHTPFGMIGSLPHYLLFFLTGTIALILVLRYATLTNTNLETSPENAVGQACAQYLDSEWDVKIDTWLGVSARTEGEIIAFINSVPWDMAAQAENVVTSQ